MTCTAENAPKSVGDRLAESIAERTDVLHRQRAVRAACDRKVARNRLLAEAHARAEAEAERLRVRCRQLERYAGSGCHADAIRRDLRWHHATWAAVLHACERRGLMRWERVQGADYPFPVSDACLLTIKMNACRLEDALDEPRGWTDVRKALGMSPASFDRAVEVCLDRGTVSVEVAPAGHRTGPTCHVLRRCYGGGT